jgi:hypothetical protein
MNDDSNQPTLLPPAEPDRPALNRVPSLVHMAKGAAILGLAIGGLAGCPGTGGGNGGETSQPLYGVSQDDDDSASDDDDAADDDDSGGMLG